MNGDAPYHGAEAWDDPAHTGLYVFDGELFLFEDEEDGGSETTVQVVDPSRRADLRDTPPTES